MRMTWATEVTCDGCGAKARVELDGMKPQIPAGWFGSNQDYAEVWELRNPFGQIFNDLCPECSALPFRDIPGRIIDHFREAGR